MRASNQLSQNLGVFPQDRLLSLLHSRKPYQYLSISRTSRDYFAIDISLQCLPIWGRALMQHQHTLDKSLRLLSYLP